MRDAALVKTVFAAVLCGFGVTCGLALSPSQGPNAWLMAAVLVTLGFVMAAIPIQRRKPR